MSSLGWLLPNIVRILPRSYFLAEPQPSTQCLVAVSIEDLARWWSGQLESANPPSSCNISVRRQERGERACLYTFDESIRTARVRAKSLGLHIEGQIAEGHLDPQAG